MIELGKRQVCPDIQEVTAQERGVEEQEDDDQCQDRAVQRGGTENVSETVQAG
jgi:hypothetical protein